MWQSDRATPLLLEGMHSMTTEEFIGRAAPIGALWLVALIVMAVRKVRR